MRPERALRRHLKRSGRVIELVRADGVDRSARPESPPSKQNDSSVRPELTAREESFYKIAHELPPMFERHYQELALDKHQFPLDPDWDAYLAMAAIGKLHITTARFGDILAGYIFNLVGPHLHYKSSIHGHIEMFWLDPVYRGGAFALKWFKANEDMLRKLGVKRVTVDEKHHFKDGRVGLIFRRLGYSPVETVWQRVL